MPRNIKLDGVYVTITTDYQKECEKTTFVQIDDTVLFKGVGFFDKKGTKTKFKNYGYTELPDDELKVGSELLFSWCDTFDSDGSEVRFPHKMKVTVTNIVNGKVSKLEKVSDERISTKKDDTKNHGIGDWRQAEKVDFQSLKNETVNNFV